MFVKVFRQILDSSIADNAKVRRMFIDLLILADQDGVVDMTHEAIARRIGVPLDEVVWAIGKLLEPDPADRSGKKNGARLEFIDPGRDWGWHIINYAHYRGLRDEESRRKYRRGYMRDYMRHKRESNGQSNVNSALLRSHKIPHRPPPTPTALLTGVNSADLPSENVNLCKPLLTPVNPKAEAEAEVYKEVPSTVSQRETVKDNFKTMKEWLNKLFGRKRAWSYEENRLLTELLPISREDRALLSWAYTLPRDAERWALIDGERASKPKQSLITLLREFSSEVDKWRGVRSQVNTASESSVERKAPDDWTRERQAAFLEMWPASDFRGRWNLLDHEMREEIDAKVKELASRFGATKSAA